ncbi:hypothetical protein BDK51DRAFT_3603, partial [Blyttiomyces helicus]
FLLVSLASLCSGAAVRDLSPRSSTAHVGQATYYYAAGLGACGTTLVQGDNFVAVADSYYQNFVTAGNPNDCTLCGQEICITNTASGATAKAIIRDRCGSCGINDLDLATVVFDAL